MQQDGKKVRKLQKKSKLYFSVDLPCWIVHLLCAFDDYSSVYLHRLMNACKKFDC